MDKARFFFSRSFVPTFPLARYQTRSDARMDASLFCACIRYQVACSVAVATAVFVQPAVFATRVYASSSTRLSLCTIDDCHARENILETLAAVYRLKVLAPWPPQLYRSAKKPVCQSAPLLRLPLFWLSGWFNRSSSAKQPFALSYEITFPEHIRLTPLLHPSLISVPAPLLPGAVSARRIPSLLVFSAEPSIRTGISHLSTSHGAIRHLNARHGRDRAHCSSCCAEPEREPETSFCDVSAKASPHVASSNLHGLEVIVASRGICESGSRLRHFYPCLI
jgi:hypothetical protein